MATPGLPIEEIEAGERWFAAYKEGADWLASGEDRWHGWHEWVDRNAPALLAAARSQAEGAGRREALPTTYDCDTIEAALRAYANGDRLDVSGIHADLAADLHHYGDLMHSLGAALARLAALPSESPEEPSDG